MRGQRGKGEGRIVEHLQAGKHTGHLSLVLVSLQPPRTAAAASVGRGSRLRLEGHNVSTDPHIAVSRGLPPARCCGGVTSSRQ